MKMLSIFPAGERNAPVDDPNHFAGEMTMRRMALLAALAAALGAGTLAAQGGPGPGEGPMPGPPPRPGPGPGMAPGMGMPMGPPPPAAGFFLGHTGELRLTDAQVVRLAAIARRAAERRDARRPAAGAQRPDAARMRQLHEQMREQARADLREALAVLTPDQQARAWEMMAHHPGGPGGPGGRGAPGRPGRMAPGAPGGPPPMDGRRDGGDPPPPRPQG